MKGNVDDRESYALMSAIGRTLILPVIQCMDSETHEDRLDEFARRIDPFNVFEGATRGLSKF